MNHRPKYLLVETDLLPDVFVRVVEANRLLQSGIVATVNDAVTAAGISRSAFYKYRSGVKPFTQVSADRIVTFHMLLSDEAGLLSVILGLFAKSGANILTIHQSMPVNGQASVTISARIGSSEASLEALLYDAGIQPGVIRFEILASE